MRASWGVLEPTWGAKPKIDQKSPPKSSQNRSKINEKSMKNRSPNCTKSHRMWLLILLSNSRKVEATMIRKPNRKTSKIIEKLRVFEYFLKIRQVDTKKKIKQNMIEERFKIGSKIKEKSIKNQTNIKKIMPHVKSLIFDRFLIDFEPPKRIQTVNLV